MRRRFRMLFDFKGYRMSWGGLEKREGKRWFAVLAGGFGDALMAIVHDGAAEAEAGRFLV